MFETGTRHPRSSSPALRERPPPVPWLTPVVIPAMLVLLGATALIYLFAAR